MITKILVLFVHEVFDIAEPVIMTLSNIENGVHFESIFQRLQLFKKCFKDKPHPLIVTLIINIAIPGILYYS